VLLPVIDADSHVSEPPDLWTARLSSAGWGDQIPHLEFDERRGYERWVIGGKRLTAVAGWAMAGWNDFPPSHPRTMDEADPGAFDPVVRAERLDEFGVTAQVLYPNLLAFFPYAFLAIEDRKLRLECVQAYNDFLVEFSHKAPGRFIPLTALPFWDVKESVEEMRRCHGAGHRGIVFAGKPYKLGLPNLSDPHWGPIFEAAEALELPVNFHVGFQEMDEDDIRSMLGLATVRADYAKNSALSLLGNAEAIADVIMSGICEQYPNLKFVSVESGFGWLPYFVESMDWQWLNSGAAKELPDRLMPREYFRRQVYGSFWFERDTIPRLIDLYPDNMLFETDFPHPTSLSPGPASSSENPRDMIRGSLQGVPEEIQRKVLFENAARLYKYELHRD
jgi:predicted TIM-barrel fold metal-dependent hydrolase